MSGTVTAFSLPTDAFEKADAKVKAGGADAYADLTDEERAEEDLPPREPEKKAEEAPTPEPEKKPDAEPEKKPAPAVAPEPEPEDVDEPDPAIAALFEEIAGIREDIASGLGKPEPAAAPEEDALLKAAMEHEDPVMRGLAERLQKAETKLATHEKQVRTQAINQQQTKDSADFDAVQSTYVIAGKPMTDAHVEQVENYMLAHPAVCAELSIEQITGLVFPGAVKGTATPTTESPAKPPGKAPKEPEVATIVDAGVGAPSPKEPWKPGPNESIESAVAAFGRKVGWKR